MKAIVNSALSSLLGNGGDVSDCIAVDTLARPIMNLSAMMTGSQQAGKAHGAAAHTIDIGMVDFGVRRDTLTTQQTGANQYNFIATDAGERTLVCPYAPPGATIQGGNAAAITGTTSTQIIAADATNRIYVTNLSITNESAVASRVDILDGATVIWRAHVPANNYYEHTFHVPLRGTVNTALNAQCATTATSTFVSVTGYKATY